jgi:hypothetical protein
MMEARGKARGDPVIVELTEHGQRIRPVHRSVWMTIRPVSRPE